MLASTLAVMLMSLAWARGRLTTKHREEKFNENDLETLYNITLSAFNDSHSLAVISDVEGLAVTASLLKNLQLSMDLPVMFYVTYENATKLTEIEWSHEAHHSLFVHNLTSPEFLHAFHLNTLSPCYLANAKALFLSLQVREVSAVESLLHLLWHRYQMYKAVILMLEGHGKLSAFTFMPSNPDTRCSSPEVGTVIKFDPTQQEMFPDKMLDMKSCFIKTLAFHIPPHAVIIRDAPDKIILKGIFGELLNILAVKMNVSFVLEELYRGNLNKIEEPILNGSCDVLAVAVVPTADRSSKLETTNKFGETGITFAVPKADFYPSWSFVFRAFDKLTWTFIASTFILSGIFLKLIAIKLSNYFPQLRFLGAFLLPFSALIGNMTVNIDKLLAVSVRMLMMTFLLSGIVIDTVFHSSLFREMTFPERKPDIGTISELLNAKLILKGPADYAEYFKTSDKEELISLAQKMVPSSNPDEDMEFLGKTFQYGIVGETFMLHTLKYNTSHPDRVHIGKNHLLMVYYTTIYLQKRSIFTDRFNKIIGRVTEGGLVAKWYKDYMPVQYWVSKATREHRDREKVVLSLDKLAGGFLVWGIGFGFALVAFLNERLRCPPVVQRTRVLPERRG